MTPRLLDQHRYQGSVHSSCQDLRTRSQEFPSSSFSSPTHGKNGERKIEQVLVHNTNTGKHGQTSFADLRHAQGTKTTRHCQQPAVDQQEIYTTPTFRHFEKSSTDQVQIFSSPNKHCQTTPLNHYQDLALGNHRRTPNASPQHVQDTASGKCYQTPQTVQQPFYRGASARFPDRHTPAGVHSRQNSVHVGFSATEATGPGQISRAPGQCTNCQNLHKELGELRAKLCTLERQLSEKEYETIHLRETIDRNEKAILQSFEEVRRRGDVESSVLKRDFENYLRAQLQNSFRNEDALRQHIAMLTQENAQLQDRVTTLKSQREEFATRSIRAEWQLERTKRHVKDLTRELNQRKRETVGVLYAGALDECSAPPVQYASPTAANHSNCVGLRHWKSEDDMKGLDYKEVGRGSRWNTEPEQSSDELSRRNRNEDSTMAECIQLLQAELQKTRDEMERGKREFEEERSRWEEEKSKVLSYQRFLQMNYLQLLNGRDIIETDAEDRSGSGHKLSAIIEEETL